MDILTRGIVFDVSELPREWRGDLNPWVTCVLIGYNQYSDKLIQTPVKGKILFEEPEKMIHLDHDKWLEFKLIEHLPPDAVYAYFFNNPSEQ